MFGWLRDALGAATAGELYARAGLIADLAPSHVLACLDIQRDQLDGVVGALTAALPPGAPAPRALPVLRARVTGVQGREVSLENYEDVRGRGSLAREYTVTYRATLETPTPPRMTTMRPTRLR